MGLFDSIYCEINLPFKRETIKHFKNTKWNEVEFQTKDLDCLLSKYILKKSGDLVQEIIKYKYIKKQEKQKINSIQSFVDKISKNKKWSFSLPYKSIEIGRKYKKLKHTGIIHMGALVKDDDQNTWDLEFDAKFIDGKLTVIKQINAEIWETRAQAEKKQKEFQKMIESNNKSIKNKIIRFLNFITLGYWRWTWMKIANLIVKLAHLIQRIILHNT